MERELQNQLSAWCVARYGSHYLEFVLHTAEQLQGDDGCWVFTDSVAETRVVARLF